MFGVSMIFFIQNDIFYIFEKAGSDGSNWGLRALVRGICGEITLPTLGSEPVTF